MTQVQGGLYSFDAYYTYMESAGMYPEGWTQEEEKARISAGLPMLPAGTDGTGSEDDTAGQTQDDTSLTKDEEDDLDAAWNDTTGFGQGK
jgi:hypothetical protein